MAEPSKKKTEEVFRILKGQAANKVRQPFILRYFVSQNNVDDLGLDVDVFRLSSTKSYVVQCYVWSVHMSRLFQRAP